MTILAAFLLAASGLAGAELKPQTTEEFRKYIAATEHRLAARPNFLWCDAARARAGELVISPTGKTPEIKVTGGLIHDWVGCAFIPGATLARTLAQVQNYDRHKDIYKPEVIDSRLLSHSGNDYRIYLRLLKKKVITVVLNTEHDVRYFPISPTRARSYSFTTKISEVENAGKPDEREQPPGTGHGFLWRLDSFWRFEELDGGVYIECQAVSLTRDVPAGLGWLIEPIIRNLPRESLASTLKATRTVLEKR